MSRMMSRGAGRPVGQTRSCLAGNARHVLGIAAYRPGSAACLLRDGEVVAIAREERFSGRADDASFPARAIDHCLSRAEIGVADLDYVGFHEKPLLRLERMLESGPDAASPDLRSFGRAVSRWTRDELFAERDIRRVLGFRGEILYAELHESRAASAFFTSPFQEAAIIVIERSDHGARASIGVGRGRELELLRELRWPVAPGRLYPITARYAGIGGTAGDHPGVRLASDGEPRYVRLILEEIIELHDDGSFALNHELPDHELLDREAGSLSGGGAPGGSGAGRPRVDSVFTREERDLACSVGAVREMVLRRVARHARRVTEMENACIAGGLAPDHFRAFRGEGTSPFDRILIEPVAGAAPGAMGIAKLVWHRHCGKPRRNVGPGATGDLVPAGEVSPGGSESPDARRPAPELRDPDSPVETASGRAPAGRRLLSRVTLSLVILLHSLVIRPWGIVARLLRRDRPGGTGRRSGWSIRAGEPSPTDMERRF